MEEVDTVAVKAVTNGGLRLELRWATVHEHLGEILRVGGGAYASEHTVAFRADVGLLTHNVVIQGDSMSQLDRHGVHIMLHSRAHASIVDRSQGESLTARIENVEVRYAGQMGRLGRYPVHFHMIGAVRGSYVRGCAIHHTYNRAIAIHGVHYLRVQNNGVLDPNALSPTPHSPPLIRHLHPPDAFCQLPLRRAATPTSSRTGWRRRTSYRATSAPAHAPSSMACPLIRPRPPSGTSTATITLRATSLPAHHTMATGSFPSPRCEAPLFTSLTLTPPVTCCITFHRYPIHRLTPPTPRTAPYQGARCL